MSDETKKVTEGPPGSNRPKSGIIKELIMELGKGGLDDDTVKELVRGLRQEHPENDAVIRLSETVDLDDDDERDENEFPWILFALNGTAYGINSKNVLSIEILGEITPVVDMPHYCPGITRSRGELIEIADMRALFGSGDYISAKQELPNAVFMMIVTEIGGVKRGLIVDEILAVEHITRFDESVVSGRDGNMSSQYVERIARREKSDEPVLILNPERIIAL